MFHIYIYLKVGIIVFLVVLSVLMSVRIQTNFNPEQQQFVYIRFQGTAFICTSALGYGSRLGTSAIGRSVFHTPDKLLVLLRSFVYSFFKFMYQPPTLLIGTF